MSQVPKLPVFSASCKTRKHGSSKQSEKKKKKKKKKPKQKTKSRLIPIKRSGKAQQQGKRMVEESEW
jgi:hypothetical protein